MTFSSLSLGSSALWCSALSCKPHVSYFFDSCCFRAIGRRTWIRRRKRCRRLEGASFRLPCGLPQRKAKGLRKWGLEVHKTFRGQDMVSGRREVALTRELTSGRKKNFRLNDVCGFCLIFKTVEDSLWLFCARSRRFSRRAVGLTIQVRSVSILYFPTSNASKLTTCRRFRRCLSSRSK